MTNIDLSEGAALNKLIEKYNSTDEEYMSYTASHRDTYDSVSVTLTQYHFDSLGDSYSVEGTLSVQM